MLRVLILEDNVKAQWVAEAAHLLAEYEVFVCEVLPSKVSIRQEGTGKRWSYSGRQWEQLLERACFAVKPHLVVTDLQMQNQTMSGYHAAKWVSQLAHSQGAVVVVATSQLDRTSASLIVDSFVPHISKILNTSNGPTELRDEIDVARASDAAPAPCLSRRLWTAFLNRDDLQIEWKGDPVEHETLVTDAVREMLKGDATFGDGIRVQGVEPVISRSDLLGDVKALLMRAFPHASIPREGETSQVVKRIKEKQGNHPLDSERIAVIIKGTHQELASKARQGGSINSLVFRIQSADESQPSILKIAPEWQIVEEVANYRLYVHGNVAPVIGYIRQWHCFWGIGVIRYVFAGKGGMVFEPVDGVCKRALDSRLSLVEREASLTRFKCVLSDFFLSVWTPQRRIPGKRVDLQGYTYLLSTDIRRSTSDPHKWRDLPKEDWKTVVQRCQETCENMLGRWGWSKVGDRITIGSTSVAADFERALDYKHSGGDHAITHGDLHGGNLMANGDSAWVLDFERSGYGPPARDAAELEMCLLTEYWPGGEDEEVLSKFRLLFNGGVGTQGVDEMVKHLRKVARVTARSETRAASDACTWQEYCIAVYAHAMFIAWRICRKGVIRDDRRLKWCLLLALVCAEQL